MDSCSVEGQPTHLQTEDGRHATIPEGLSIRFILLLENVGFTLCHMKVGQSPHEPEAAHTRASSRRIHAPKPFPATCPGKLSQKTAEGHSRIECIATVLSEQAGTSGNLPLTFLHSYE